MPLKNLQKISLRIEQDILDDIDSLVDYINIKNRSDSIRYLVKKAFGKEKIAVILSKGNDKPNQNIKNELRLENNEYNLIAEIINGKTLAELQIELLNAKGFKNIYFITTKDIINPLKSILGKRKDIHYIENNNSLRTMDALKLLKGKINTDFLVIFGHNYPNMDLEEIFEIHTKNNHYITLNLTWSKGEAYNYVDIDGTKVTDFEERSEKANHLTYNAIFVAHPKFLDEKGHSLVYDVFPRLAKEQLMHGFITKKRIPRLKTLKDKEIIKETLI